MSKGSNIHVVDLQGEHVQIGMFSDLHWDNPKTRLDILKRDLEHCKKNNIKMFFNGDTFCLMQGRGDRRGNKSDIRPEHNNAFYFDSIVNTAVDFFLPYADHIIGFGQGNHETGIIKHQETDILQRFVDLLNAKANTKIQVGGYGGWIVVRQIPYKNGTMQKTWKIKYYHGSGGGGLVTRGAINLTRALETYEGFDVFTMGHIHENSSRNDSRDVLVNHSKKGYYIEQKQIHMMLTGTYKEEYGDGSKGWHVERGAPPKPIGGRILQFTAKQMTVDGEKKIHNQIDSFKFPL
jgi:predicted phosphodiesterase